MKKFLILILLLFIFSSVSYSFTPGNIVVVRVGDGVLALSSSGALVFLEEYTPAGVLVQTTVMPTVLSGLNKRFVITGNSTSEGNLTLSGDKHYITFCGYDTTVGTTNVATTAGISRVIALVSETGVINTSTTMTDGFLGSNIRGSFTIDGSAFWASGTASPSTSGGVRYVLMGTSTSTQISNTVTNTRFIYIYNNQLYISSASGAFLGVNTVGTGTPTTTGQTTTNYINTLASSSSYGFAISPDGNTCYIADDRSIASGGGVQKWIFSGGWSLAYTLTVNLTTGCRGLAVNFSGANPVIFATNNVNVAAVTDLGAASAFTLLSTAGPNTVYRGISFAPGIAIAPPAPPNPVSPGNSSVGNLTSLNLVWNKSTGASTYRVQLATDAGFSSIIVNDSTLTDSVKSISGLSPLTNYWWRVNAKNAGGTSSYSTIYTFKTLGVPFQITGPFVPPNNSINQPINITLMWGKPLDQTLSPSTIGGYWFELALDSVFPVLLVTDTTLLDTNKTVSGLNYSKSYIWRVKAKNQIGYGSFSAWQRFTTAPQPPAVVTLKVIPGGFYNSVSGRLNMKDTVKAYLVDSANCTRVDSSKVVIDSLTFSASLSFSHAATGNYYLYIYHRNHLPVASRFRQTITRGSTVGYDLTTDSAKAFGFNMIKVSNSPIRWAMIPGDANRDEFVDGLDQSVWIIQNGSNGYFSSDFNGDGFVDGLDQTIWIVYNGMSSILPCPTPSVLVSRFKVFSPMQYRVPFVR